MNNAYYTYRIRIANHERVQVEKRGLDNQVMGEPNGRFGYSGDLRTRIDKLVTKGHQNELLDDEVVKDLGEALFDALFDDGLRQDFVTLYNQAIHNEGKFLRIELDVDEAAMPEVAALPWEFMCVPSKANLGVIWLGTAPKLVFSRRRSQWFVPLPIQLQPGEKLRIALAVAAPSDLGPVVYDKVEAGLQKLVGDQADKFELLPILTQANASTIDDLLAQNPHIFHFIGHGRFYSEGDKEEGQLALVDDLFGEADWVDADFFAGLLNTHRPGVVVLHACEGGQLSSSKAFVGVASRVVQQNIPVVVAMQYEVTNNTALRFALRFYKGLAEGEPVDTAAQYGRCTIALNTKYRRRDFATPVLFMRVADGHLFTLPNNVVEDTLIVNDTTNEHDMSAMTNNEEPPAPAAPATLTLPQVSALGKLISDTFSIEELQDLAFALGLDYDNLRGGGKSSKARDLADYARRHGTVADLWQQLYKVRGHVDWSQALT